MARTLIIGYGNPLRGDDGIGWHVAQQLASAPWGDAVDIISCHQLTPELAEPLSHARRVVFIDAWCRHGREPSPVGGLLPPRTYQGPSLII